MSETGAKSSRCAAPVLPYGLSGDAGPAPGSQPSNRNKRHNWASVASMNGVDMVTVAKLLGHALVEITAG